jgi:hypothetical protein
MKWIALLIVFLLASCRSMKDEGPRRGILHERKIAEILRNEEERGRASSAFASAASEMATSQSAGFAILPPEDGESEGIALWRRSTPWCWYEIRPREAEVVLVRMEYSFPRGEVFIRNAQSDEDWVNESFDNPMDAVRRVLEEISND